MSRRAPQGSVNVPTVLAVLVLSGLLGGLLWSVYGDWIRTRCTAVYRAELGLAGPPPRPSERAWHAEHCWMGSPR